MNITQKSEDQKVSFWLEKLHTQQVEGTIYQNQEPNQKSKNKGTQDAVQAISKKKGIDETIVKTLIKKSNRILVSITSHKFPFDFNPNTINVEESRITIINRNFLSSSQIHSIDIRDISNIFINLAFRYAQLIIVSGTFSENNMSIDFLRKKEAIHMRRIIEGLRVFENKKIDTSNYSSDELVGILEELSTTDIVT